VLCFHAPGSILFDFFQVKPACFSKSDAGGGQISIKQQEESIVASNIHSSLRGEKAAQGLRSGCSACNL
jgi:hypothetical protein